MAIAVLPNNAHIGCSNSTFVQTYVKKFTLVSFHEIEMCRVCRCRLYMYVYARMCVFFLSLSRSFCLCSLSFSFLPNCNEYTNGIFCIF